MGHDLERLQHELDVAQRALAESEKKLELFIRYSPSATAMFDRDMRYIVCSNRWILDYGIENSEFVGRSHYEVFPDIPVRWKEIHQRGLAGAIEKCDEDLFQRADGSTDWVRWEMRPWLTGDGSIGGVIIFSEVITSRKQAEMHQKHFRTLLDHSSDAIEVIDPVTLRFIDVNETECRVLGYSREELLSMSVHDIDPVFTWDGHHRLKDQILQQGSARFESVHRRKDGTMFPVEISVKFVELDRPYLVAIASDITDRKIVEAKLERHKKLYAALSQCNKAIVHCTHEAELFSQVCHAAVQFGGMKMAWIGLVDPQTRMVQPVASFGEGADYLSSLKLSLDADSLHGGGPTCIAIRENRPYWCQDLLNDPATLPWHELIRRADWAALASLPLHRNGVVIGSFILYSSEIHAFDEMTRDLLTEMAADISFALDAFGRESRRELAEQDVRDAEEQFRGLVEQSIAGICIIQDEKFTYANPRLAEIMGLDSAKALVGSDPLSWIVEAERAEVARNIRRLLKGEVQNLALEFGILHRDGVEVRVGTNAARATQRGKVAIIGVAQDISEKKRAEEKILDYIEQLKTTLNGTIEVVETIHELRDPYTAGHEQRVAQIAVDLAAELGLDANQQEGLRVAGNLHDVGKIVIPAEILSKPSKLSPIEYALVQGHAQAGYEILKNVKFPWPVAQVVLQHHERMDGSGYPQGLKGEAIMIEARIMAVADVVEAMGSHRPYRPGLNIEAALGEIERGRSVKYDATVVDACLKLFREQDYKLPA